MARALGAAHLDVADYVDHLAQPRLVQGGTGVVLGQHAVERRVVPLDGGHGLVHSRADSGLSSLRLQHRPARLPRHPEDALGEVLVPVLGGLFTPFGEHRRVALLECVGDILEKDQTEDDVLVLGGVHAAAQGVGHPPQFGPEVQDVAVTARFGLRAETKPSLPRLCHRAAPLQDGFFIHYCPARVRIPDRAIGRNRRVHTLDTRRLTYASWPHPAAGRQNWGVRASERFRYALVRRLWPEGHGECRTVSGPWRLEFGPACRSALVTSSRRRGCEAQLLPPCPSLIGRRLKAVSCSSASRGLVGQCGDFDEVAASVPRTS